jgi:hypothetical protein
MVKEPPRRKPEKSDLQAWTLATVKRIEASPLLDEMSKTSLTEYLYRILVDLNTYYE